MDESFAYMLTFENLLTNTGFVDDIRQMLQTLEAAYQHPVDVEFTVNFLDQDKYKINLLQCRPFQAKPQGAAVPLPRKLLPDRLLFEARGAVIGRSRELTIDRLIYVVPSVYAQLAMQDKYGVARLIGEIAHAPQNGRPLNIMLLGPGRWGTSTPSLGVPIRFSEIDTVAVLCEIVTMREDLVPEVSLGTHLFSEMVEMDTLYLALFPARPDNFLNDHFFQSAPNKLLQLLPKADKWLDAVRVIDPSEFPDPVLIKLNANSLEQRALCYLEPAKS